jgi:mono/diheme cytochrome c family protein
MSSFPHNRFDLKQANLRKGTRLMNQRAFFLAILLLLLPAVLLAAPANENNADVEKATWADDVAPLLFENCATCHRPGQVAPMSLLSYEEARPWAKSIRKVTSERSMPPWFANPAHGEFVEDPTLTEEEIATISNWVAAGAPSGDLSKAPAPPEFSSEWMIGTPDAVMTMEPFEVTDDMEDHYQWVQVKNPLTEGRWIKAIEIRPTFKEGAHHNLTYIGPPDATLDSVQSQGRLETEFIAGWAPGVVPMEYADGFGKFLPADATIFFQMHYHKDPGPDTGGIDETSVGLKFYDEGVEVENKVATMWIVDPILNIPPGEANYQSQSVALFEHEAMVFNFTPHMHLRGKAMRFTAKYPDGTEQILLDVPDYDFNWQLTYTPPKPLIVPAGTRITLDAVFDNSAGNPANPDPTATVTFGEATTDEMMIGFLDYTFVDRAQQTDMPTYAVPEKMKEQFEKMQEFREKQKQAAAQGAGRD